LSGYFGLACFGIPLVYLLHRANSLSMSSLAVFAIPTGALAFYVCYKILEAIAQQTLGFGFSLVDAFKGALLGVIVVITFGLLAGITKRSRGRVEATRL
jgi:hypothetical protein